MDQVPNERLNALDPERILCTIYPQLPVYVSKVKHGFDREGSTVKTCNAIGSLTFVMAPSGSVVCAVSDEM